MTEAAFISEEITQCRFRALLEISDSSSSKLNRLSNMICQCWLDKHFEKLHNYAV